MTDDEADYLADQVIRIIKLYAADDRDAPGTDTATPELIDNP